MKSMAAFEAFWDAYPLKRAKYSAMRTWGKMRPDAVLIERIMHAVEQQKQTWQWQKQGGQFVPSPTAWLRGGRWLDQLGPDMAVPGAWKAGCTHEPPCGNATNCQNLRDIAAYKAAQRNGQ